MKHESDMGTEKKIETDIVNAGAIFVFISIYIFGGTLLFMFLTIRLRIISIAVMGFLIFWIFPIIFQKKFCKPFSRRVDMIFKEDSLSLNIYDDKPFKIIREQVIQFDQIYTFRISVSSKDESSFLKFNLKNGEAISHTFMAQSNLNAQKDISDSLFDSIRKYNSNKDELEKIMIIPSLFATKIGKNIINLLTLLLVVIVIWQISVSPKTIPISLLSGLILYIMILAQQKKDAELIQRLK